MEEKADSKFQKKIYKILRSKLKKYKEYIKRKTTASLTDIKDELS